MTDPIEAYFTQLRDIHAESRNLSQDQAVALVLDANYARVTADAWEWASGG